METSIDLPIPVSYPLISSALQVLCASQPPGVTIGQRLLKNIAQRYKSIPCHNLEVSIHKELSLNLEKVNIF